MAIRYLTVVGFSDSFGKCSLPGVVKGVGQPGPGGVGFFLQPEVHQLFPGLLYIHWVFVLQCCQLGVPHSQLRGRERGRREGRGGGGGV